ncbi:MAG TPA: hypothetical protein VD971_11145 [Phycisphaerales bacterium]|nr:hypothetical protein [Phycisphaerales bacterium]
MGPDISQHDPEVAAVEAALTRLGSADRARADDALVGRVAAASWAASRAARAESTPIPFPARTRRLTPMRAAASVALMAALGAAILASRSVRPATGPARPLALDDAALIEAMFADSQDAGFEQAWLDLDSAESTIGDAFGWDDADKESM